jgi:hypothetical protein
MKHFLSTTIVTAMLLAAGIAASADQQPAPQPPPLSVEYSKLRDLVLPNPREQSFRTIPWRISVLQGIVDAQKNDKPVMLVLMNGHPLGCT